MLSTVHSSPPLPVEFHTWLQGQFEREIELPLLPEVASRIVAMCEDDDTDLREVKRALEQDPSLASNFLRIANSSLYASNDSIVSLQQAVNRLGLNTTRTIALSASLRGGVFSVPAHEDRVRAIWHHSVVCASFAREIARRLRSNVEGAFLCALLHDIGQPIVLQAALAAPESLAKRPISPELLESAMREFHADIGGRLIQAWRLADWTVAAVTHHHRPELAAPFENEARLVRLADLLAHWALDGEANPEDFPVTDPVVEQLGLYRESVEELLALRSAVLEGAKGLS